jgi:formylglycine-generating enzyme required for sulfatase activity
MRSNVFQLNSPAWMPAAAFAVLTLAAFGVSACPSVCAEPGDDVVNSLCMKFVHVPKGAFQMGSPETEADRGADEKQHDVQITKPFYIGAYEVTQKQYEQVMGSNPSFFTPKGPGGVVIKAKDSALLPVEGVTWHDAVKFCDKLGERLAEKKRKFTYRLPTEAEWEYACRAGTKTPMFFGDNVGSDEANFNGIAPLGKARIGPFARAPWTVGFYKKNAFGLADMHGNVAEWVNDWYDPDYYKNSPPQDPAGPNHGTEKVVRGGGWSNTARACRSAARQHLPPNASSYNVGFRVVLMQE